MKYEGIIFQVDTKVSTSRFRTLQITHILKSAIARHKPPAPHPITHDTSESDPKTKHPFPLSSFSYSLWNIFLEGQLEVDLSLVLEIKLVTQQDHSQSWQSSLRSQGLNWIPARSTLECFEVPWGWPSRALDCHSLMLMSGYVRRNPNQLQWVKWVHVASWSQGSAEDSPLLNLRSKGSLKGRVQKCLPELCYCPLSPPQLRPFEEGQILGGSQSPQSGAMSNQDTIILSVSLTSLCKNVHGVTGSLDFKE